MEFTGPHVVKLDKWISPAPFEKLLNMTIHKSEKGEALLSMPFYYQYAQGAGLLHGGAIISLADTAVAMAMKSVLEENTHFATIEVNARFLYPVKKGMVKAYAKVTPDSEKERIFNGIAEVFNEEKIKVLDFSSVFKIARNSKIIYPTLT